MSDVVMFLSNEFKPDPRVAREAAVLTAQGLRVSIICWDRRGTQPEREVRDDVEVVRVSDVGSDFGVGWRQAFRLPRFWRRATRSALERRPRVVHCHDLDTLYAGVRAKRRLGCRLIYDAHEHYPAMVSTALPAPAVTALARWERRLLREVDAVVTASTVLRDEFLAKGVPPPIEALGNYQDLAPYHAVPDDEVQALRAELGAKAGEPVVAYIGAFSPNRLLDPFLEAAALLPHVQFHIWGDGLRKAVVEHAASHRPNVRYHGWLRPADLPRHFKAADIIYYCLRPDHPGAAYNAPNALACAMAAGRPIVASDVGDLGRIVRAADCGILLKEATPAAIAAAIERLSDPAVRARLGANAWRAARATYNATAVGRQLLDVYDRLGLIEAREPSTFSGSGEARSCTASGAVKNATAQSASRPMQ